MIRAVFVWFGLAVSLSAAADPLGEWVRSDHESQIEISPCGPDLCAVNEWVRDPKSSEKAGDVLVMSLQETAPGHLEGQAYDKRRDMSYAMTLSFTESDMRTEGCVLMGLLCRSAEWVRP